VENQSFKFQVEYHTENNYDQYVKSAHWQFLILPQNNSKQKRLEYSIKSNLQLNTYTANHLFSGELLNVRTDQPFKNFQFSMCATVNIEVYNPFDLYYLSPEEERALIESHEFAIEQSHFLFLCKLSHVSTAAASKFPEWRSGNLIPYLQQLMDVLQTRLDFSTGETEVTTNAEKALSLNKGVCQDFAHIFIGLLRRQGIASRYVCGYLCQGLNFKGDSQLHAWVECFIPGTGWVGFDPSNKLLVNYNYIKIAHGRNYEDCPPIRGVLETKGTNSTSHQVKIFQLQQQQ
jgi:hypothetical protein